MADENNPTDWDNAYANGPYIPDADAFPPRWEIEAQEFRQHHAKKELNIRYGSHERELMDLFYPSTRSMGLMFFVHGGYWHKFDKNAWSRFATGGLAHGMAVAVPNYPLAPEVKISDITVSVSAAIETAAEKVDGAIYLTGHSAGGHLVSRMACEQSPLSKNIQMRIKRVMSISGLHDLMPLMKTQMNRILKIDENEAKLESAVFHNRIPNIDVNCWVGGAERPEFIRQSKILSNSWEQTDCIIDEGKHHFNIIDGLCDPDSSMMQSLFR